MKRIDWSFFFAINLVISYDCFGQDSVVYDKDPPSVPKVEMSAELLKVSHLSYIKIRKILKKLNYTSDSGFYSKVENYEVKILEESNSFTVQFWPKSGSKLDLKFGGCIYLVYNKKTLVLEDTIFTK